MANRDVKVRLLADPSNFKQGFLEAGASMRVAQREAYKMEKAQREMHAAMEATGPIVMGAGVAIAAALGYAAKAAIDWESAWADVQKTVDGTPEQMAALEQEIRGLAKVLPQTHEEIAAVAAAAGQLGVAREDIVTFTETMVAMGVATNLSSEEAATSLARMMNIMNTAPADVAKLGATIVDLGNNAATTEAEIMEMSLRIAGAGATLGMSEAEVLAFSTALSSVGINAEAGGSAISTFMLRLANDMSTGSDRVSRFAEVAGMSVSEFTSLFQRDAAGAIDAFVSGLSSMQSKGGDVNATLTELGITEIRQRDSVLRLTNANGVLTDQLDRANKAWEEGNALIDEASQRYQTTESQMAIARNRVNDLAISFGEYLLPIVGDVAAWIGGLADAFAKLPEPVKQTAVVLALAGAAIGVFGGAAMLAVPRIAAFNAALGAMDTRLSRGIQAGASRMTSFLMGPWGIALGIATIALTMWASSAADSEARMNELTSTLDEQTGAVTANSHGWALKQLEERGVLDSAQKLGVSTTDLTRAILGESDALERVNAILEEQKFQYDETGFEIAENSDAAIELQVALEELNGEATRTIAEQEKLADANRKAKLETEGLSASEQALADQLGITADKAADASAELSNMDQELRKLLDTLWMTEDAEAALTLAIDRATEAIDKNGSSLDTTTKEGAENHKTIKDLTSQFLEFTEQQASTADTMEDAQEVIAEQRAEFEDLMRQLGFTEEEIQKYAKAFDNIPALVETAVEIRQHIYDPTTSAEGRTGGAGGGRAPYQFYSRGGYVSGPGGPTDDRIPAMLSDGEYVINAKQTAEHRQLLDMINRGTYKPSTTYASALVPRTPVGSHSTGGKTIVVENVNVTAARGYQFDIRDVERSLKNRGLV